MAKTRSQKETLLEDYKKLLTESDGYIAVDSKGIDNTTVTELKKQLKDLGSNLTVVKNTLWKIAVGETKQPDEVGEFEGQTAVISYKEDPTAPAKLLKEVQKETEMMEAKYGVVNGEFLDSGRIMDLADIPSREVLLAKLLGSMTAPVSGFMNAVTGNARGFVQVLRQLSEKRGSTSAEAESAE